MKEKKLKYLVVFKKDWYENFEDIEDVKINYPPYLGYVIYFKGTYQFAYEIAKEMALKDKLENNIIDLTIIKNRMIKGEMNALFKKYNKYLKRGTFILKKSKKLLFKLDKNIRKEFDIKEILKNWIDLGVKR